MILQFINFFLKKCFQDSVLVENMNDIPYQHTRAVGSEVVSVMTRACARVRRVFDSGPVGVQVLAGANRQALAVALASGCYKKCQYHTVVCYNVFVFLYALVTSWLVSYDYLHEHTNHNIFDIKIICMIILRYFILTFVHKLLLQTFES